MGISLNAIEKIAKYAESSGVKFCIKPPKLNNTSFEGLKMLEKDVFTRLNPFFVKMTEAENALLPKELQNTKMGAKFAQKIPKIKELPYEKSYIYNQDSKFVGMSLFGKKATAVILPIRPKYLVNFDKTPCGLIHNHPTASTLSIQDLKSFFEKNFQTIMATSPTSGYAVISKMSNPKMNLFDNPKFAEIFKELEGKTNCAQAKINIEGLEKGHTTSEIYKKMNHFMDRQIKNLTERVKEFVNLKYEYKPTKITSKHITESEGFGNIEAFKAKFVKEGHTSEETEQYCEALRGIPLEKLYL